MVVAFQADVVGPSTTAENERTLDAMKAGGRAFSSPVWLVPGGRTAAASGGRANWTGVPQRQTTFFSLRPSCLD